MNVNRREIVQLAGVLVTAIAVVAAIAVSMPTLAPTNPGNSTVAGASSPSPTTAQSTDTPTQTPSSSPAASCCTPSGTPSLADLELQRSDSFWQRWQVPIHIYLPHDASSLAEEVGYADLIVRGQIADLYIGEYWRTARDEDPMPLAYVSVRVDQVLKGKPAWRTPGFVEVQMGFAGPDLESLRAALPAEEYVWFLKGPEGYGGRDLPPQNQSELAPFSYVRTNDYQGVLGNIDGKVNPVGGADLADAYGPDHFPLLLKGTDFASFARDVQQLAPAAPTTTP